MVEISIFTDESGEAGTELKYYLLTLVFHEQDKPIANQVELYEQSLTNRRLQNIPLHASPLLNGKDDYKDLDVGARKQLLSAFFTMLQHLPISYKTLAYKKSEFSSDDALMAMMKRDIVNMMFENLDYLQEFDKVKIYYDDEQAIVTNALHDAAEYALATEAIIYKDGDPKSFILAQAADLICTLELTAIKYENNEQTRTDERFFGAAGSFKKNWLKKIRKMLL